MFDFLTGSCMYKTESGKTVKLIRKTIDPSKELIYLGRIVEWEMKESIPTVILVDETKLLMFNAIGHCTNFKGENLIESLRPKA